MIQGQFKFSSDLVTKSRTVIKVKDVVIGKDQLVFMAGPCSIESLQQIDAIAYHVAQSGGKVLRGGAFKPRTSPYSFQGLGEDGLKHMKMAADKHGLVTVSEVIDAESIDIAADYIDMFQVGSRNMQNFSLLKKLGKQNKPVFLKRGCSATYQEFLLAAEYIISAGNEQVILCERGIRTFENYSRYTLDISAVPILKELTKLPVFVDPSHGTGLRQFVAPMAKAAVAAGADGLMIEVHTHPDQAVSDAAQTISTEDFAKLVPQLEAIYNCLESK